ncbi:MAG TPA: sigma-70 family RNA polymerase sigma factor [Thermoanaerobaculia bacterium]|nr:sigma-70 family RNA polymerase sigma factor [Thermoanaerobaculia bacterium]
MDAIENRFDELVRSSARLVRAAILRVGGRAARHVEDLEQRVYLALWRRFQAEGGPPQEIAAAYVYRSAVREAVRELRSLPPEEPLAEGLDPASPAVDPERQAAGRELGERIAAALARLAPDRRRAVAAHLQGFEVAEIQRLFDWDYQRARNLIARGLQELRQQLAPEVQDE